MKKIVFLFAILLSLTTHGQTTWIVDSLGNSGYGSFRAAVDSATAGDTIRFNPSLIAFGTDSIVLDSSIKVNSSLTIIGLYTATDSLIITGTGTDRLINCENASLVVLDSMICQNGFDTLSQGGAVRLHLVDSVVIRNSFFRNNQALFAGGGVSSFSSGKMVYAWVYNSVFKNNMVTQNNSRGGGLHIASFEYGVLVEIDSCIFVDNVAKGWGGGLYTGGDGPNVSGDNDTFIDYSVFSNNKATRGAGICTIHWEAGLGLNIYSTTIAGNRGDIPSSYGAGLYYQGYYVAELTMGNTTITDNKSSSCIGGGIYGKCTFGNIDAWIFNSTIYDNDGIQGGGVFLESNTNNSTSWADLVIGGTILAENGGSNFLINGVQNCNSVGYNAFSNGTFTNVSSNDLINKDSNDINLGPLLMSPFRTPVRQPLSPSVVIDAGKILDTSVAQNGPVDSHRDIGAAEACETVIISDTLKACDSYMWNGVLYTSDTITTIVKSNGTACDSILSLNLTISHSTSAIDSIIAVNQFTWIDGVTYYAHNSTATHTLTNSEECDSLVTLYLEIQVVEIGLDQVGSTLSVTADSGTFQWVECPDYDIIPGATDSTFTPTQNGSYAVIVTQNGYTDTSDCITVSNVGIVDVSLNNNIRVYPNPVQDQVHIEITNWPAKMAKIVVRDVTGKQVYDQEIEPISKQETISINTAIWANGTYFIEVGEGFNKVVEQIVVQ